MVEGSHRHLPNLHPERRSCYDGLVIAFRTRGDARCPTDDQKQIHAALPNLESSPASPRSVLDGCRPGLVFSSACQTTLWPICLFGASVGLIPCGSSRCSWRCAFCVGSLRTRKSHETLKHFFGRSMERQSLGNCWSLSSFITLRRFVAPELVEIGNGRDAWILSASEYYVR